MIKREPAVKYKKVACGKQGLISLSEFRERHGQKISKTTIVLSRDKTEKNWAKHH